jgi:hypothetical protein
MALAATLESVGFVDAAEGVVTSRGAVERVVDGVAAAHGKRDGCGGDEKPAAVFG